jgi:hypothetical protein
MTGQRVVRLSLLALVMVLIAWIGSIVWTATDEGAVPADSAFQSLATEMALTSERCEAMNLWTLRKTCTGISNDREGLKIYLRYSLLLSKY